PNIQLIDILCAAIDNAFGRDPALAERFPDSPPSKGRSSATLKTHVTDRLGHDRRYAIDETKSRIELGYAPTKDFPEYFDETLTWYLKNETWWRSLRSPRRF